MSFLRIAVLGFILYACTRKTEETPKPTYTGGGSSGTGGTGGTGGNNVVIPANFIFDFVQKYNSNPLPSSGPYGNGYVQFQFASWSIISSEANSTNAQLQSWIDFKLFDSDNNLVCYILDKRANYHPNYISYFPSGTDLRSNNHLADFNKYLPYGAYRLEIKNISPNNVNQNLRLGTQGTGGDVFALLHEDLAQGATKILNFTLSEQTDGRSYVFNCNVY